MFEHIVSAPMDPTLGLTELYRNDSRSDKINLGVGMYKNDHGDTPVLDTVKEAETYLLNTEVSKSYLSMDGIRTFGPAVQKLLFGEDPSCLPFSVRTAQAPGGTGALRIAGEFIYRQLQGRKIWISQPTWANHIGIFQACGLEIAYYRYYDADTQDKDFQGMLTDLSQAQPGDVVLFHGCCHNPSGVDPTQHEWEILAALCHEKSLLPLVDFAYQGFAVGTNEDAQGIRILAKKCPYLIIANSFSKNFGLYNERIGGVTLVAPNEHLIETAFSQMKAIIRTIYSSPPAHGGAVVCHILNNSDLYQAWQNELAQMRERIQSMRHLLVKTLHQYNLTQDFTAVERQYGMFSFSGLNKEQVLKLRQDFGIYIVDSGRINVAGITTSNIDKLCESIAHVVTDSSVISA